eukprot:jgi/Antlo1/1441/450
MLFYFSSEREMLSIPIEEMLSALDAPAQLFSSIKISLKRTFSVLKTSIWGSSRPLRRHPVV